MTYRQIKLSTGATGPGWQAFDIIAEVTDADYEWSTTAILRRPSDGALFYVTDSGCSCYGFGENIDVSDLQPVRSINEAVRKVDPGEQERLRRSVALNEAVYR